MTDSSTEKSDAWIKNAIERNPCVLLDSGNIRTCPVRLSFVHLFKRPEPTKAIPNPKFQANLIFPLGADITVLKEEAARVTKDKWSKAGTREGPKLKSPFKDQADMLRYDGYTEGGIFISPNSDRKPTVVDARGDLITADDSDKVYPGVWAVCTIRPYTYDVDVNKGTSFGLQTVMIVAEDKNLGGGGREDVVAAFAGITLDDTVDSSKLFD